MYTIIELQTNGNKTSHIITQKADRMEALSKYHAILSAAAISAVEYHSVIVIDERGLYVARECYEHPEVKKHEEN